VFYLTYVFAELRRRRSRTILTALGLAVGVALVVTVNAVSSGLDGAQKKVLAPLTGVGTDMSVTRPIKFSQSGGPPPSAQGGGGRLNFRSIKPGAKIDLDAGMSSQITFSDTRVTNVESLDEVSGAAGYSRSTSCI
jgi:ABC-type antimicrobial peptide transport system permease subunit